MTSRQRHRGKSSPVLTPLDQLGRPGDGESLADVGSRRSANAKSGMLRPLTYHDTQSRAWPARKGRLGIGRGMLQDDGRHLRCNVEGAAQLQQPEQQVKLRVCDAGQQAKRGHAGERVKAPHQSSGSIAALPLKTLSLCLPGAMPKEP